MSKFMTCLETDSSIMADQMKLNFLLEEMTSFSPVEEGFSDKIKSAGKAISEKIGNFFKWIQEMIDRALKVLNSFKNKVTNRLGKTNTVNVKGLPLNFDYRRKDYVTLINTYFEKLKKQKEIDEVKRIYDEEFVKAIDECEITIKDEWIEVSTLQEWVDQITESLKHYKKEADFAYRRFESERDDAQKAKDKNEFFTGMMHDKWAEQHWIICRFFENIVTRLTIDSSKIMNLIAENTKKETK